MEYSGVTKEFLEKALGFSVEKFEVKAGSSLGDGYTCGMIGVEVWKQADPSNPISIVVKCYPENETRQEFLQSSNIFGVELGMYNTVIPALTKFQDMLPQEERVALPFAPFIFGQCVKPEDYPKLGRLSQPLDNVIIMPDLRNRSNGAFRLCDRFVGLDLDHYKLVIEGQARLHAVSWAYKCKRGIGSLYDDFPFLNNDLGKIMKPFLQVTEDSIKMNEEVFRDNPEILQGLAHLRTVHKSVAGFFWGCDLGQNERGHTKDNVLKKPGKIVENEAPWNVLRHGDCWSNNMMFRYDEKTGRPVEVVFIDLQICQESDPMFDICYALFASAQPDLRRKHLQSMLHVYYDTFTATCQKFGVPPLPGWGWEEFNRRFRRATIGGGYMALEMHVMLKNVEDCENLDEAMTKLEGSGGDGGEKDALESMCEYFKVMSKHTNLHPAFKPRITAVFEDLINDGVI